MFEMASKISLFVTKFSFLWLKYNQVMLYIIGLLTVSSNVLKQIIVKLGVMPFPTQQTFVCND